MGNNDNVMIVSVYRRTHYRTAGTRTARNPTGEESFGQGHGNPAQGPDPSSDDHYREHSRDASLSERPLVGLPTSSDSKSELTTTPYDTKNNNTRAHHPCAAHRGLYCMISRFDTLGSRAGSDSRKILRFYTFNAPALICGKIVLETEK